MIECDIPIDFNQKFYIIRVARTSFALQVENITKYLYPAQIEPMKYEFIIDFT